MSYKLYKRSIDSEEESILYFEPIREILKANGITENIFGEMRNISDALLVNRGSVREEIYHSGNTTVFVRTEKLTLPKRDGTLEIRMASQLSSELDSLVESFEKVFGENQATEENQKSTFHELS